MTIGAWITQASQQLADELIPSARLDAEIILAHTLSRPRTWLHAHSNESLDPGRQEIAEARLRLRIDRVPVAYIIGHKDFYGRRFHVSPAVLIPRPESEMLIELFLRYAPTNEAPYRVIDIGTGSGCLGITAKLERPSIEMTLSDISRHARHVAKRNARQLKADVWIIESDLLTGYSLRPQCIIANLPYVDPEWKSLSPELSHEPPEALFAKDNGLALVYKLIEQASHAQQENDLLLLEVDPKQSEDTIAYAAKHNYTLLEEKPFALAFQHKA